MNSVSGQFVTVSSYAYEFCGWVAEFLRNLAVFYVGLVKIHTLNKGIAVLEKRKS